MSAINDRTATRLGIVGLGRAGGIHLDAMRSIPDVEITAVCDPHDAARATAEKAGVVAYATLDAMLESARMDGVVICTPPADHAAE
jgi:predicted dehydrogenase